MRNDRHACTWICVWWSMQMWLQGGVGGWGAAGNGLSGSAGSFFSTSEIKWNTQNMISNNITNIWWCVLSAPGPVRHLSFTEILDTSLRVSWAEPEDRNGIVTGKSQVANHRDITHRSVSWDLESGVWYIVILVLWNQKKPYLEQQVGP